MTAYPMTCGARTQGDFHRTISQLGHRPRFISIVCPISLARYARVRPMFGAREIFLAACWGWYWVVVAHRGQSADCGGAGLSGLIFLFSNFFPAPSGLEPVKIHQTLHLRIKAGLGSGVI